MDCLEGKYYWTDVGSSSIRSSKYDGSERKPVVSGGKEGAVCVCLFVFMYYLCLRVMEYKRKKTLENPIQGSN